MNIEQFRFPQVFRVSDRERSSLATKNLVPGLSVYGEKLVKIAGVEYRLWSTRRSKLAAAIKNGLKKMPIDLGSHVLYLGAASGTTTSHISDIIGPQGFVNAVEFSIPPARKLIALAESRNNIVPIVEDARHPVRYASLVTGPIDVIYQDIAQPDQVRILYRNLQMFCSVGAWALIAIKAKSIDSTVSAKKVLDQEVQKLRDLGLQVVEQVNLEPYEKDHVMAVVRLREEID